MVIKRVIKKISNISNKVSKDKNDKSELILSALPFAIVHNSSNFYYSLISYVRISVV